MRRTFGCAAVALSGAALLAAGAWAETAKDDTVLGRPRPDYTPVGIELGGGGLFTLFPKVTTGMLYDDNIFRQESHRTGDLAAILQPEVRLVSDWEAHALSAGVFGNIVRYFNHQKANFADWGGSADGRLDITDETDATGFVEYARLHEDRSDPNSAGPNQDTIQYDRFTRRLGLEFKGSPIFARVTGEWASFNYYDNNGFNYDDRDYDRYETRVRVGADVTPNTSVFVEPGYNWRVYHGHDDFGFDHDSHGYDVHGGTTYDVSGVTFLEMFGSYYRQSYDDPRFGTDSGIGADVDLTWNPSDTVTVTGTVQRVIEETAIQGASGIVDTGVDLTVDWELLDNLIASAHGSVHDQHFRGIGRYDTIVVGGLGATYLINQNFSAGLDYSYGQRNSDAQGEDYYFNRVMVHLTGAL